MQNLFFVSRPLVFGMIVLGMSLRIPGTGCLSNAGATFRNQLRAAIDQAAVNLHQAGAGVDFFRGVRAVQDAADADDRQRALQVLVRAARITAVDLSRTGAPDRPPVSAPCGRSSTPSRDSVVLVAITPSMRCCISRCAICAICSASRSGAIFSASGTYLPCARRVLLFGLERRQQGVQRVFVLQLAQVLGVGRGDVDRDVAGVRIDLAQADQVIVRRLLDRRVGVLADVDAEHAAVAARFTFSTSLSTPSLLKPMRLMMALRLRQAEQARLAGCRAGAAA